MPKATISSEPKRFDLVTAPPDGYVVLKRLNYGQTLKRQSISQQTEVSDDTPSGRAVGRIHVDLQGVAAFDFRYSIIEHNLTNEAGALINFSNVADFVDMDPDIANEIDEYIVKFNGFDKSAKQREEERRPLASTSEKLSSPVSVVTAPTSQEKPISSSQ